METITVKVYGKNGHKQRMSFNKSTVWNFSKEDDIRIISIKNSDVTNTNEYSIMEIIRNTLEECEDELIGQILDGAFENYYVGRVERI